MTIKCRFHVCSSWISESAVHIRVWKCCNANYTCSCFIPAIELYLHASHSEINSTCGKNSRKYGISMSPTACRSLKKLTYTNSDWGSTCRLNLYCFLFSSKKQHNGAESQVQLRRHRRTVSHTNRSSYMEAVSFAQYACTLYPHSLT